MEEKTLNRSELADFIDSCSISSIVTEDILGFSIENGAGLLIVSSIPFD
ncbi:MAG: hypothetical protein ACFFKA_19460 [Candidatus Thorarchaeota archaeon]